MSEPFIGQLAIFPYDFVPKGWIECRGQVIFKTPEYLALCTIIGTTYGGDGEITFGIPDFSGRVPLGFGQGHGLKPRILGELGGRYDVALKTSQIPAHNHVLHATTQESNNPNPSNNFLATAKEQARFYTSASETQQIHMHEEALATTGTGEAHENKQPYLCFKICIAFNGIYPPRPPERYCDK